MAVATLVVRLDTFLQIMLVYNAIQIALHAMDKVPINACHAILQIIYIY